jgi:hypothetical protein
MDHQGVAEHKLKVADHLLSMTYPIVKDPKLLIGVIENLYEAMDESITAILEHEKLIDHNTVPEKKLELFRRKIITKHSLDPKILDFVNELKGILDDHKKSSVEFSKKGKFVISDDKYNLKTLTAEEVKPRVSHAKKYVGTLFKLIIH